MQDTGKTAKKIIGTAIHAVCAASAVLLMTVSVFAQNYERDAAKIGMGGAGETDNLATRTMEERQADRSIVLPLGLIQLAQDRKYFDPRNKSFNPATLLEDLGNPIHYTFHRGTNASLIRDVVNGSMNPDLGSYRGFVPAQHISAQGLASPLAGHAFRLSGEPEGTVHSLYVGAGPYLSMGTAFNIDDRLLGVLAGQTASVPNASLSIRNTTTGQGALSYTFGYRGQFDIRSGQNSSADKRIHVAADYHYIQGLRYDSADMRVELDTGASGLLLEKSNANAAVVDHSYSSSGRGFAVDLAAGVRAARWQIAAGVNGLGNRIEWSGVRADRLTLDSLLRGKNYVKQPLDGVAPNVTIRLPMRYNGSVAYAFDKMTGTAEFSRTLQGSTFHGGLEARLPYVALRAGGRYSNDQWHPTAGLGLKFTKRISLDIAAFDTTANLERTRKVAVAASIRIIRREKG